MDELSQDSYLKYDKIKDLQSSLNELKEKITKSIKEFGDFQVKQEFIADI